MALVCGVRFRGAGKVYHFDPLDVPVQWLIMSLLLPPVATKWGRSPRRRMT